MSVAREELLANADPHDHYVQLYGADAHMLGVNVARYLCDGLSKGEPGIVIATEENRRLILDQLTGLGIQTKSAERSGDLVLLDAQETLGRFMVDGYPDGDLFESTVGALVRSTIAYARGQGIRAYGEMVGVLWSNGEFPAALRLEQLWNKLRKDVPFNLFCGYPIDIFGDHFDPRIISALLCAHTHLLPAGPDGHLAEAVNRAMSEVLGERAGQRATVPLDSVKLPRGEETILWLRSNLPNEAPHILERARTYYANGDSA